MKYQHFTVEERETIQELLWRKSSIRGIARALGRSPSSISREIKRHVPLHQRRYTPRVAHERALAKRRSRGGRKLDTHPNLCSYVAGKLRIGWSPEQVAAKAREQTGIAISHEAIYQYVYAQVYRGGCGSLKPGCEDWRLYLARRRKRRMKQGQRKAYKTARKTDLPSIERRPVTANNRMEVGHWEDDSLVYTLACPVRLRTTNDLASGVVLIDKTADRTMAEANRITIDRLGTLPVSCRQTLTRDRGSENLGYAELEL